MNINIIENSIKITEMNCLLCGTMDNLTNHHTIPQYLNPKKNIEIPLCDKCHKKLHGNDMNCLNAFAYKIHKILNKGTNNIKNLKNMLKLKQKKEDELTIADILKSNGKDKEV